MSNVVSYFIAAHHKWLKSTSNNNHIKHITINGNKVNDVYLFQFQLRMTSVDSLVSICYLKILLIFCSNKTISYLRNFIRFKTILVAKKNIPSNVTIQTCGATRDILYFDLSLRPFQFSEIVSFSEIYKDWKTLPVELCFCISILLKPTQNLSECFIEMRNRLKFV